MTTTFHRHTFAADTETHNATEPSRILCERIDDRRIEVCAARTEDHLDGVGEAEAALEHLGGVGHVGNARRQRELIALELCFEPELRSSLDDVEDRGESAVERDPRDGIAPSEPNIHSRVGQGEVHELTEAASGTQRRFERRNDGPLQIASAMRMVIDAAVAGHVLIDALAERDEIDRETAARS